MSFSDLPIELKLQIFSQLDSPSLRAMSQVSQEFSMLARDWSLEKPLLDPQTINNLVNKTCIRTEIPVAIGDFYNHYLHLVKGVPTVTTFPAPQVGNPDFSTPIDEYTSFKKDAYYFSFQKTIQVNDKEKCKLQYNSLYIDGSIKRNSITDIAFFHGKILYLDQYREGIFIFDPKLGSWDENKAKIADKGFYKQIVCDEKNGVVYGLTTNSIVKLDFKAAEPELINHQKEDRLIKTLSFIGRVIITAVGAILKGPIKLAIMSRHIYLIVPAISFILGSGIALLAGAPILPVGLATLFTGVLGMGIFTLLAGTLIGIIDAVEKVHVMIKA